MRPFSSSLVRDIHAEQHHIQRMRWFLLIALPFLIAANVQEDGQMWGVHDPVPDPVPVGYDRCIRVVPTEEFDPEWLTYDLEPPITAEESGAINRGRLNGWFLSVDHCSTSET